MNLMKTKALVISRSRTHAPIFHNLVLDATVVERVTELMVFDVVLDTKLSFEGHIRSIAAYASSKLGIMQKMLFLLFCLLTIFYYGMIETNSSQRWLPSISIHLRFLFDYI